MKRGGTLAQRNNHLHGLDFPSMNARETVVAMRRREIVDGLESVNVREVGHGRRMMED